MNKSRLLAALAVTGALTMATATSAFAYDAPVITDLAGSGADGAAAPGETFTLTGNYGESYCDEASAEFNGAGPVSGNAVGSGFSLTFTAPGTEGTFPVTIFCEYDDGTLDSEVAPAATTTLTVANIVVAADAAAGDDSDAAGDDASADGSLPDTGAPTTQLLLVGAGLVAAGAAVTVADRRRRRA